MGKRPPNSNHPPRLLRTPFQAPSLPLSRLTALPKRERFRSLAPLPFFHHALAMVLSFLLLVAARPAAWTAPVELRLTATVEPQLVTIGDSFLYRLVLEGNAQFPQNTQPAFPSFDPFQQMHVSTQQQTVFINRGVQQSLTFNVQLRSTQEGKFEIAPSSVRIGEATVQSNAVTVSVARHEAGIAEEVAESLDGFISARTNSADINKQLRGKLFLYTELDKTTAVPFEAIMARTYVYKSPGLVQGEQYGYPDSPPASAPGYLRIEGFRSAPSQWEVVEVAGYQFQRALVEEVALIPTRTGLIDYSAWTLLSILPVRGGRSANPLFDDPFGDPFFGFFGQNRVTAELPPPIRKISVKSLPPPAPSDFANIVGDFTVKAVVDREEVREGEIVAYRLIFSGKGYAEAIPEPKLQSVEGFTLFDKSKEASSQLTHEGLLGVKSFEFLLRAARPGKQIIPAREFVLFEPVTERYLSRKTEPITVVVLPSESRGVLELVRSGQASPASGEVRQIATDIAHIRTEKWKPTGKNSTPLYARPGWWSLHLLPPVFLIAAFVLRRRRDYYSMNPNALRRGRAQAEARRRLRTARKYLVTDADRFHAEIAAAIRGFLGDSLGREPSGLTNDDIERLLLLRMVPDDVRAYAIRMLDYCDTARYSIAVEDPQNRQATYDAAEEVLRRLRESLS